MLRFLTFFIVLFLVFAFVACTGEKKEEAAETEAQVEEAVTAEMTVCADCGMKMEKAKMVAFEKDGETFHFCSDEHKDHYLSAEKEEGAAEEETKKES